MSPGIAVIGGSGLHSFPGLEIVSGSIPETPWGLPSGRVVHGLVGDQPILFLSRHGDGQVIPPHQVNYRANIAALKTLGVKHIFAFNAVGGITDHCQAPGTLVVPDQIIDYTWGREHTYFDSPSAQLEYAEFASPYDEDLRRVLLNAAREESLNPVAEGVYGATQGPRLESAAEIARLERDGCDIVGMTGMPEAALAREQNLAYACLALVVNPAAGKSPQAISLGEIREVMNSGIPRVTRVLARSTAALAALD